MALIDNFRRLIGRSRGEKATNGLIIAEGQNSRQIEVSGGTRTYELLYETQPVVAAVVNKLTRQIATLPLKVYREDPAGGRIEQPDHPLARALRRPAANCGPHSLGQWIALPSLIFGNALLVKVRGEDGLPRGFLPVDWRHVNAYAPMGEPIEFWSTLQTGEELWIAPSEAVHFCWQGPRGWLGVSPLQQLAKTLHLEDSALRYQISNFDKGVRPSGALVLDKEVSADSEEAKRIRAALRKLNEGVDNTGAIMVLGGGVDFKPMSMTAAEAELILQRKLNREEVEMVYDVPPPVVGDLEHGTTYENADALSRQFYKSTLRPWLKMIEDTIKAQVIDPEPDWQGLVVRYDLSEVLRGDPAEEIRAAVEAVTGGVMTIDEARERLGLNPAQEAEAKRLLIARNNMGPLSESSGDEPVDNRPTLTVGE